ncbi:MAG: acetylxylan esterase [Verrucomicrobiae bacterium]|nr:acetylxylan esterase [Verrucomicrobiae bacterium]
MRRPFPKPQFVASVLAIVSLLLAARADEPVPTRPLRDLNKSYFPFTPVKDRAEWAARREQIRNRILLAAGLLPMPERTPLRAVIHGRIERDDYTIDKVYFESLPGHYVTGNLYLPKHFSGKIPGILCPHGHWPNGRFMDDKAGVKKQFEMGAETFENAARSPLQARCVQLARMGCAVLHYDMLGYADSIQFCDASGKPQHRHGPQEHGFVSVEAELNLCGYFGLQTWNSIRALDFLLSLPFVDRTRIGCTGASGGGTQTMILSAIDERVKAAFPCVMVSTAMQGGCTCENSHYLRIGMGNIDIAAATAPRPLGLTAANDWTKELETKGFPDLKNLYTMLGVPDRVEAHFDIQFPHNYNAVSRAHMYRFFNKHLRLGLSDARLVERDFVFSTPQELSVWDAKHPAPSGDKVGTAHEIAVVQWFKQQSAKRMRPDIQRAAWELMLYVPPHDDAVQPQVVYPQNWNKTVVVWLSLTGQQTPATQKLLDAGFAVTCPKLYLLGASKNPNVYGTRKRDYERYAGYHYGYNPPLLAERVNDVIRAIEAIRNDPERRSRRIIVAGVEGAGAIAVASAMFAGESVRELIVDLEGFRFANLRDVWDANFMPGAEKYGDVDTLLALCSARKTVLGREQSAGAETVLQTILR